MYVCTAFAQDGVTCTNWVALQQGILPNLTIADGAAIGSAAMLLFAVVWGFRQIMKAGNL